MTLRNKKAEELLAYLVISQAGKVAKRNLSALLWPNASDSERAMDSLYKVIGWIKHYFNEAGEAPLINRPSYVCLNDEVVSSDTAEFLQFYQYGDADSLIQAERFFARPITYDRDCEWLADWMGYYETCYADILETLIRYFEDSGDSKRAGLYQKKSDRFFGERF